MRSVRPCRDAVARNWWMAVSRMVALVLALAVASPVADAAFTHSSGHSVASVQGSEAAAAQVGMPSDLADAWRGFLLHVQFENHHQAIDLAVLSNQVDRDPVRAAYPLGSEWFASADLAGPRRPPRA